MRVRLMVLGLTAAGGFQDSSPGTVSGRVLDGKTGQPIAGALFDLGNGLRARQPTGRSGKMCAASQLVLPVFGSTLVIPCPQLLTISSDAPDGG